MIVLKKILFVYFFLATLVGCNNSQNDNSPKNFKNYFFQPDWFNKIKIYEYEVLTKDSRNTVYRVFEKIGENKLKSTIYDKDLNKTGIVIYEYLREKTIIADIITVEYWNNGKETKETITDNIVFEYHKMNNEFGFTHSVRLKNGQNTTKYVTRNLTKTDKIDFQGTFVDVVIADGKTKMVLKKNENYPKDLTMTITEKIIYANNIGVIYQEFKNQYKEEIIKLTRIINSDEFEKIKNAR